MSDQPLRDLDPLLHQQLRLSVISLLIPLREVDFNWLKDKTGASAGNLSVQLSKLSEAGYLQIHKSFKGKYPLTRITLTDTGREAFEHYVKAIEAYLRPG